MQCVHPTQCRAVVPPNTHPSIRGHVLFEKVARFTAQIMPFSFNARNAHWEGEKKGEIGWLDGCWDLKVLRTASVLWLDESEATVSPPGNSALLESSFTAAAAAAAATW